MEKSKYDLDHMLESLLPSLPDTAKTTKKLQKGDFIFHQNDSADAIYLVISGSVQLQRTLENGFLVVVHQAQSNESFAEAALFSDTYHCDAMCISAVLLIQISKMDVLQHMKSNPNFSFKLIKILSKQVQHYRQRLQIASFNSAEERILAAMNTGLPFEKITDLAASIGLTHEATYRALSRLTKQDRIRKTGRGQYVLKNKQDRL